MMLYFRSDDVISSDVPDSLPSPFIAQLSDSLPPAVKYISAALHLWIPQYRLSPPRSRSCSYFQTHRQQKISVTLLIIWEHRFDYLRRCRCSRRIVQINHTFHFSTSSFFCSALCPPGIYYRKICTNSWRDPLETVPLSYKYLYHRNTPFDLHRGSEQNHRLLL